MPPGLDTLPQPETHGPDRRTRTCCRCAVKEHQAPPFPAALGFLLSVRELATLTADRTGGNLHGRQAGQMTEECPHRNACASRSRTMGDDSFRQFAPVRVPAG